MKKIYTAKGLRKRITSTPITQAIVRKAKEISFHRGGKVEVRGGSANGIAL